MKKIKYNLTLLFILILTGCAAPITFYTNAPDPTKPVKIQFIAQDGAYYTFALYKESNNCTGIQRVTVNKAIYLPHQKHLTFSAYIQFPGYPSFKYGSSMYSIPFNPGELKVTLKYDTERFYTLMERLDKNDKWIPITDVIERQASQPFLESGPWCSDQLKIPNKKINKDT